MKRNIFLPLSTSEDVVIFDIAACRENVNHVESSGVEDEEEETRDPDTRQAYKDHQPQQRRVRA